MEKGTFNKVGKTKKTIYGPRAMLVCGFKPEEQKGIMEFLESIRIKNLPVVFTAETDSDAFLKDLISRPDQSGRDEDSTLARTIVLSGITENELHQTLTAYRRFDLPRPLWATLTPISQNWRLSALIAELIRERTVMGKKGTGVGPSKTP